MRTRKQQLLKVKKSHNTEKKYDAIFLKNDRQKRVSFGQKGYNDFIKYTKKFGAKTAKKHRKSYLTRHSGMGEHWNKPDTPGALARWILWNKPTFKASVRDYKKRFHL
jgi:hypothetical protein